MSTALFKKLSYKFMARLLSSASTTKTNPVVAFYGATKRSQGTIHVCPILEDMKV
jgi:hypothetical protein